MLFKQTERKEDEDMYKYNPYNELNTEIRIKRRNWKIKQYNIIKKGNGKVTDNQK